MALKYTKYPVNTFEKLVLNAGIMVDTFDPETETIGNILGATTGGFNFTAVPSFVDFGEDIDNCPKGTKELMHTDDIEIQATGTLLTVDTAMVSRLAALADVDQTDTKKVVFRRDLQLSDFKDLWIIADYGDGGYIAIHMKSVLSTGGFAIQTTDKGKGQFAFTFKSHFSMDAQDEVPCEIFIGE